MAIWSFSASIGRRIAPLSKKQAPHLRTHRLLLPLEAGLLTSKAVNAIKEIEAGVSASLTGVVH